MQVRVLGPLQVNREGRVWSPGGPKERRLLAILALHIGEVVSVDALAEALWDGDPPPSAVKTLRVYVTRLRAELGAAEPGSGMIQTVGRGYRLAIDRGAVDAHTFMTLIHRGRRRLDAGSPEDADRHVDDAFALWRGEPYGDFADGQAFVAEVRRLTETRLAGWEIRLAARLALGRHAEVVADAQALCAAHPLHEQFWIQLATALYRCDRQADALAAVRQVRTLLAEEVGADPGAELVALEQRLLRQDPALDASARPLRAASLPVELDRAGQPIVGRAEELAWLHDAWSDVAENRRSRLLAIAGPAGSGRTRLVAEFAGRLHALGVGVYYGRLGPGLAVFDDLEVTDDPPVWQFAAGLPERMLCAVVYDPATATARLRRALLTASPEEHPLMPLGRADITQIVTRIAGALGPADLDTLVDAAQGRPGLAEHLAAGLVAERSERRVLAAIERAHPASRALAAARAEVASGVRDLARVRTVRSDTAAGADRIACPYKGLARYEQSDAVLFHGRDDLVARLCARLVDTTFVAVVGPSGAGKSSLVRAGLLPALAAGVLPGLVDARQHVLAPGAPLPELDGPAIVVVDQFEEIFATITEDTSRDTYLDRLTALATRPDTRVVVVLRGDFMGACATHPRLAELLGDGTVLVGPMRPEEIQRAVELPARHVGLTSEPALTHAIVSDMQVAPGALPLMSTALVEVWRHRAAGTLTAAAYHRAGGVSGALTRLAETAYGRLDEPARAAARRILLRLADTGEGGALVRRRVPRRELGDDPATTTALTELVNRRLLTAGDAGIEVTHEALLTHWPRLAGWLADDERGRELRRHLAPAAAEWDATGRPDSELYRGARLASALDWAGDELAELTDAERDFLSASRDYADRELADEIARADRQTRARRRLVAALAAALSLLLVASAATWLAVNRQRAASAADRQSRAHRLGALALVTPDLDRSLLLAVQAVRTYDDWETRGDLLAVLGRSPQALRQVRGVSDAQGTIGHVGLTPDGSTVVATQGDNGGRVYTWNAATLAAGTGEPTVIGESDPIRQRSEAITPGPDPSAVYISVALDYLTQDQAVYYWDARARQTLATYPLPKGVVGSTRRVAESADRRVLAVPTQGPLLLYDRSTRALWKEVNLPGTARDVWPIGSLLMTTIAGRAMVVFVDPLAGAIVDDMPLPFAGDVVLNPAGTALLVYGADRAALVAIPDGQVIREFRGATRAGAAAAFSPDGTLVAVGGEDHLIGVWDVDTDEPSDVLRGHAGPVHGLVFSKDGQTLYSASRDNSVIAWDVKGDKSFAARPSRAPVLPAPAAFADLTNVTSPGVTWTGDRRQVVVMSADTTVTALIDVATGTSIDSRDSYAAGVEWSQGSPVFDADRQAALGATTQGNLVRFDMHTGAVVSSPGLDSSVLSRSTAVSGDGRVMTVETVRKDADGTLHTVDIAVRDAATLTVSQRLPAPDHWIWTSWLNRDGSLLVTTHDSDTNVEMWDTRTAHLRWRVDIGHRNGQAIALSPDGRTLVVGTYSGAVVLLDVATGRVLAEHSLRLSARIWSADFQPDGGVIALGGDDGQVHLLTANNLREIGQLPIGTGATWAFPAHSADGSMLYAVDERGRIVRWDARSPSWINRACSIAGRNLSASEWDTYLPGVARQRPC
jgi:DNA-binding SARP family transcriptional activator/WD40 repeat protein